MKRVALVVGAALFTFGCSQAAMRPSSAQSGSGGGGAQSADARIDTSIGHGGKLVSATLTGAAEVPGPGDPDGTGTAEITLNPGQSEVCYALTVSNIAPAAAAHIHRGPAGVAGPVVVSLIAPTNGSSQACRTVSSDLIREIMNDPSLFYVNVHNAPFPAGAVRGQLQ